MLNVQTMTQTYYIKVIVSVCTRPDEKTELDAKLISRLITGTKLIDKIDSRVVVVKNKNPFDF